MNNPHAQPNRPKSLIEQLLETNERLEILLKRQHEETVSYLSKLCEINERNEVLLANINNTLGRNFMTSSGPLYHQLSEEEDDLFDIEALSTPRKSDGHEQLDSQRCQLPKMLLVNYKVRYPSPSRVI
jgi:hypothetical protein